MNRLLSTVFLCPRFWIRVAAVVLFVQGSPLRAEVDQARLDSVKAGFVFNFAKFVEWPLAGSGDSAILKVCSSARNPLGGQLTLLQGRKLQGRSIDVRTRVPVLDWPTCHVLFLPEDNFAEVAVETLALVRVLTISDAPGFAQRGGMIELVTVENRMRFVVNLAAANRSGIRLSGLMLQLAARVIQ